MPIELLAAAAELASSGDAGIEPGILRFSLVCDEPVDDAALRAQIAELAASENFVLRELPGGGDPAVRLLEFPGARRLQSTDFLFAVAQQLTDALPVESCTPDADAGWDNGDELGRDAPESIGGVVAALCNSHAAKPSDPRWAVNQVRAPQAWARFGTKGAGIKVGQPDTGVADHSELSGAIDLAAGRDVLAGHGPPRDPLSAKLGNPGHGTATASCVASRESLVIAGAAPEATVVPFRCVERVVLTSGAAVATSLDLAREAGCHVVTMSLGGPFEFPDLKRAIARAVAADMIVLAAAGNCVGLVVYPAWDANVIAVAGVDQHGKRWRGSSHGSSVDISAPGENVYVAHREKPSDTDLAETRPGQGTSFAVATVAGCAALWLAHFGPAAVKAAARAKGSNVQELFRAALDSTAHAPTGWPHNMGAGIVDAERLLGLDPTTIAIGPTPLSGNPFGLALASLPESPRFAAEVGYLAFDRVQRATPARQAAIESNVTPTPSPQLAAALAASGASDRLRDPQAPVVTSPITPELPPDAALMLAARSTGTESASVEDARAVLGGEAGKHLVNRLATHLGQLSDQDDRDEHVAPLRRMVLESAADAVAGLAAGVPPAALPIPQRMALEALVKLEGRPALLVKDNGEIDFASPALGEWSALFTVRRDELKTICAAVGRIDVEFGGKWFHAGTGTLYPGGLVVTNRHVMEGFAEPLPSQGAPRYILVRGTRIDFSPGANDPAHQFEIDSVVGAGTKRIGRVADPAKLDMAVLRLRPGSAPLPAPVSPQPLALNEQIQDLIAVGYPAEPTMSAAVDPVSGKVSAKAWDRLMDIYQLGYGKKYVSPGLIMAALGTVDGDPQHWAFSHDATTLPGNSGSLMASLGTAGAFGLHFGGAPLRQNLAHGLSAVRAAGVADPAALGIGLATLAAMGL